LNVCWMVVAVKALLHPNTSLSPPGLIQKITDFLPMSTNFCWLYLTATKELPQHYLLMRTSPRFPCLPPLFQLIVVCMFLHWERWHEKKWVFCDIFVSKYV
jgi:hypothetical protein